MESFLQAARARAEDAANSSWADASGCGMLAAAVHAGSTFVLHGLMKRNDLNGKVGTITSFNDKLQRWRLDLDQPDRPEEATLDMREKNLTLL